MIWTTFISGKNNFFQKRTAERRIWSVLFIKIPPVRIKIPNQEKKEKRDCIQYFLSSSTSAIFSEFLCFFPRIYLTIAIFSWYSYQRGKLLKGRGMPFFRQMIRVLFTMGCAATGGWAPLLSINLRRSYCEYPGKTPADAGKKRSHQKMRWRNCY